MRLRTATLLLALLALPRVADASASRDFVTDDRFRRAAAVASSLPVSMWAWAVVDDNTGGHVIVHISESSTTNNSYFMGLRGDTTDILECHMRGVANSVQVTSAATYTAGTWYACGCAFVGLSDRSVYLDGTETNSTTLGVAPVSLNRTSVGSIDNSSPTFFTDGRIAYAAVWNVQLTDDEFLELRFGTLPDLVRPNALVLSYHLHETSATDDAVDYSGGTAGTQQNSPGVSTDGPRVHWPTTGN
jgi:hypothetical protein